MTNAGTPAVAIAGMHRSGTSMVAKLLRDCGLHLGRDQDIVPPKPDNPEGFWEHRRFVDLNEDLLSAYGGAWDLPLSEPLVAGEDEIDRLRSRARVLLDEFNESRSWGWKDPRNSITMPFWLTVLPGVRVVIAVRNPLEVALSLARRNGTSFLWGLHLWRYYNERLLATTTEAQRIVTHYDAHFAPDRYELRRLLRALDLSVPHSVDLEALGPRCQLRHSQFTMVDLIQASVPTEIVTLYRALCLEAGWPDGVTTPIPSHGRMPFARRFLELASLRDEVDALHGQLATHQRIIDDLQHSPTAHDATPAIVEVVEGRLVELRSTHDESLEVVRRSLAETDERIGALDAGHAAIADQLADLARLVIPVADTQQVLREDLAVSEQTVRTLESDSEALASQIADLRDELALLTAPPTIDPVDAVAAADADAGDAPGVGDAAPDWGDRALTTVEYTTLVREVCEVVDGLVPRDAAVAVVSKGDPGLLQLGGRRAWHFPQTEAGQYAGHYPADDESALAQVELVRSRGARYLVFPDAARWWLDHYVGLRKFLDERETPVWDDHRSVIYELRPGRDVASDSRDLAHHRLRSFLGGTDHLVFPQVEAPTVSIVIPTYRQAQCTYVALESLLSSSDATPFEVVIVDNASNDDSRELFGRLDNVRVHLNETNLGFGAACNIGADLSRGEYVVFLNSDTMAMPGWLAHLVRTIETRPGCGAVGGKLVHPDGALQEAGGVIWQDASTIGYGRGEDPNDPAFSFVREVDYCSAACLLVRRDVFHEVGGFDDRYAPAYYEDVDLCMAIRAAGHSVVYQPDAVVFHLEFGSSDRTGAVELQLRNRRTFASKWRDQLTRQPSAGSPLTLARERRRGPRVLVCDDRIPESMVGSGFPRSRALIDALVDTGHMVTYLPLTDGRPRQPATSELHQRGVEVLHSVPDVRYALGRRAELFDVIIVSRPHNAKVMPLLRELNPSAAIIYDAEAVTSLRDVRQVGANGMGVSSRVVDAAVRAELELTRGADAVIAVSEPERALFQTFDAGLETFVWGHSIPVRGVEASFEARSGLLFVGNLATEPNADALDLLLREAFPEVRARTGSQLFVVGANPSASLFGLDPKLLDSVVLTGYVDDLSSIYDRCRVFVAPHRFAAGIPLKVVEAMANGVPCVVSDLLADQLETEHEREVLVARDSAQLVEQTMRLYEDSGLWAHLHHAGIELVRRRYDPEQMRARIKDQLEAAMVKAGRRT